MNKQIQVQDTLAKILSLCEEAAVKGKTSWEWQGSLITPIDPQHPNSHIPFEMYPAGSEHYGLVQWTGTNEIITQLKAQGLNVYYDNGYDWYESGPATLKVSWEENHFAPSC